MKKIKYILSAVVIAMAAMLPGQMKAQSAGTLEFALSADSVAIGDLLTITNNSSGFASNAIYFWSFGDICFISSGSGVKPDSAFSCKDSTTGTSLITHIYITSGSYNITLSTKDATGNTLSLTKSLVVKAVNVLPCVTNNCNLICNGSLENRSICFGFLNPLQAPLLGFNYIDYWSNVHFTPGPNAYSGSPDWYSKYTCTNSGGSVISVNTLPLNNMGCQADNSGGNGYIGIYTYQNPTSTQVSFREYATSPLNTPMVQGNKYLVTYYVSLAEASKFATYGLFFNWAKCTDTVKWHTL